MSGGMERMWAEEQRAEAKKRKKKQVRVVPKRQRKINRIMILVGEILEELL